MKEVKQAIPEAEHEPTASLFETNLMQSMLIQDEKDMLNDGHMRYPQDLYDSNIQVRQSEIIQKHDFNK